MFEQVYKNIDDILHKDTSYGSELDYMEQISWIFFLKYLDIFEKDKKTATLLSEKTYQNIIEPKFQRTTLTAPKFRQAQLPPEKWKIDQTTFNLSVKKPNTPEEAPLHEPKEILQEMAELNKQSALLMDN